MFGLMFWLQTLLADLPARDRRDHLFFFTALAGRLWCGYACPQTVWTEVFLWIERFCEGRRNQRIKLDSGPWTREKILRKTAKQFLWITLSLWTGFTFVGFFTPILALGHEAATLSFGGWEGILGTVLRICHTATPVTCASRCASTCARTHASRARCSTMTR
jgi:polyferredoxin